MSTRDDVNDTIVPSCQIGPVSPTFDRWSATDAPVENWQRVVDIFSALIAQGHLGVESEDWLVTARQNLAEAIAAQEN